VAATEVTKLLHQKFWFYGVSVLEDTISNVIKYHRPQKEKDMPTGAYRLDHVLWYHRLPPDESGIK
jgi:hypothetical protein